MADDLVVSAAFPIGTLIRATLRPQDLIPTLLMELRCRNKESWLSISSEVPHADLMDDDGERSFTM